MPKIPMVNDYSNNETASNCIAANINRLKFLLLPAGQKPSHEPQPSNRPAVCLITKHGRTLVKKTTSTIGGALIAIAAQSAFAQSSVTLYGIVDTSVRYLTN